MTAAFIVGLLAKRIESPVKFMTRRQFTYTSYRESPPKVLLVCSAQDILDADKKLMEATGVIAAKDRMVGCSIINWHRCTLCGEEYAPGVDCDLC